MSETFDIVCFGQSSIDNIINDKGKAHNVLGGAAVYPAVIASSIGAKVALVSRIGEDFDASFLQYIQSKGVNTEGVKQVPGPSTRITLAYQGETHVSMEVVEGVAQGLTVHDYPQGYEATRVIHITPAPFTTQTQLVAYAREKGVLVSLDPHTEFNNLPFVQSKHILRNVDIFFANEMELRQITKRHDIIDAVQSLLQIGPQTVVIMQGSRGAWIFQKSSQIYIPAIHALPVVDCVGAGDAFVAGFLVGFLEGQSLHTSGLMGAACSAYIISGFGLTNVPTRQDIITLLDS